MGVKEAAERFLRDFGEALSEIREITAMDPGEFLSSRRSRFSLRYSVIVAVEAAADLAIAILGEKFGVEVHSYREAFLRLAEKRIISAGTAESMARMVGLRNLIVHRYWVVEDLKIFMEARTSGVRALERFMEEVRGYIEAEDP